MIQQDDKRRRLLNRLSRQLAYTAPALVLMAGGAVLQATADNTTAETGFASALEAPMLLASNHAEGEAEAEAEGEAEGEGEGEAEAEGEAEGEGEGEAQSSAKVQRPEGYTPGYSETGENRPDLIARGEELYYDTSLSSNGLSCASCHGSDGQDQGYLSTFEQPYPHQVAMGDNMFGMSEVHADEMVQICMVAPMEAEPLDWEGEELMSLSAYIVEVQRRFAGQPHNL